MTNRFMHVLMSIALPFVAGCGFFTAHYHRTTLEPYAGVQSTGKAFGRTLTTEKAMNLRADVPRDSQLMTDFDEGLSRVLILGQCAIDLPFSFAADTMLLPFQTWWYLFPSSRPDFVIDDEFIRQQGLEKK